MSAVIFSQLRNLKDTTFDWSRFALLVPLVGLSWWSTTNGIIGIIEVGSGPPTALVLASIAALVLVLTCLMSFTVGVMGREETGRLRPLYGLGYALLATISVGFGFGFYWSMIEARASAQREAVSAIEQTTEAISTSVLAVQQAMRAIDSVAEISQRRADSEARIGGTCEVGAPPGPGPRFRLRQADAAKFHAVNERLRSSVYGSVGSADSATWYQRLQSAETRLSELRGGALSRASSGEAAMLLAGMNRELSAISASYEAFRGGPTVTGTVDLLQARARNGETGFIENGYAFSCHDPNLETSLKMAAAELTALPPLPPTELTAPLGAEATVVAFRRLTNTIFNVSSWSDSPEKARTRYDECMREQTASANCAEHYEKRMAGMSRLGGRDIVPLLIAVSVDLFIFLLSFSPLRRPTGRRVGQTSPRLAIAYSLLGRQERGQKSGPVAILMEQIFWHRGAYHLALPVCSQGEAPLTTEEYNLGIAAAILADSGYLLPLSFKVPQRTLHGWMASRYGKARARPIRRHHDVYRIEPGALPHVVAEFSQCESPPSPLPKRSGLSPMRETPSISRDWRFGMGKMKAKNAPSVVAKAPSDGTPSDVIMTPSTAPVLSEDAVVAAGTDHALLRWIKATSK